MSRESIDRNLSSVALPWISIQPTQLSLYDHGQYLRSSGNILTLVNPEKACYIPKKFPEPLEQVGPTCGLYALYTALCAFNDSSKPPHATKDGDRPALLTTAKKLQLTHIGAFFSVHLLKILADKAGFNASSHINKEETYLNAIIENLDAGNQLVVATYINKQSLPTSKINEPGSGAHWVMLFGYFYNKNNLFFLVCHNNSLQAWRGDDLLATSRSMPIINPHTKIVTTDHDTKQTVLEWHDKTGKKHQIPASKYDLTLSEFAFSFLSIKRPIQSERASILEHDEKNVSTNMSLMTN